MLAKKTLELMYARGEISRREFLTRLSALGLSVMFAPALLSSPVNAATPKKGGVLRIGMHGGSTIDSLDPRTFNDTFLQFLGNTIYNQLAEIDVDGNAIPELAESWEMSEDASTWHFKLRKGVEFFNGKSLDAQDVIYSINLHRGEATKSGAKTIIGNIKNIKVDGKYSIIFELHSGHADFPYTLTDYHLGIVPDGTTNFDDANGTGGYKIDVFEPGVRCFAKRNPNYWKAGRAHFDAINILAISDPQSRTVALKSGKVDYISRVDKKTANLLGKAPSIQIVEAKYGTVYKLVMQSDVAPYDNNDVRLALKYAVDRQDLLKRILSGYGNLGNDQPIPPTVPFFNTELPQRKYDPDKARYHLKKAGAEGFVFKINAADAGFPGGVDACILYKEHAAKAGINIEVVRVPNDGYWSNTWMKVPFCLSYEMVRPIADMAFSMSFAEDAAWNESNFKHKHFNSLLKSSRSELDTAKRQNMYSEMQRIVRDESGTIIPMFSSNLEAASTKLRCDKYSSAWELDGLKLAERWWFES